MEYNEIKMYSIYSAGKSIVTERFIKTLKVIRFTSKTTVSKNVNFDVLDDIVD